MRSRSREIPSLLDLRLTVAVSVSLTYFLRSQILSFEFGDSVLFQRDCELECSRHPDLEMCSRCEELSAKIWNGKFFSAV